MTDPFQAYAKAAATRVSQPAALLGPIKRRADARLRYAEIVAELADCASAAAVEQYLERMSAELAQFAAELEFLWVGNGEFLGLRHEVERARARFDAGLDFPRWEPSSQTHHLGDGDLEARTGVSK